MNNRNRVSTKKKKRRVRPRLVPSDGVRAYYSSGGIFASAAGMIPMVVLSFMLSRVEKDAGGGFAALLPELGCALLAGGLLAAFATACMPVKKTGLYAAIAGTAAAAGAVFLFIDELTVLFGETTALGALQTVSMLAFLAMAAVVIIALLISATGARMAPVLGTILTATLAAAGVLFAIRVMTTFSSVFSSIGKQFIWSNEMPEADREWILRMVEPDSPLAGKMFNVHLAFCLAVILAMLTSISAAARFKQHFESFNKRLAIAVQMYRDGTLAPEPEEEPDLEERYQDMRGIGDSDGFDDDLEYYDGMETLERDLYEESRREDMRRYEMESRRVQREAAYRMEESDEFDEYEPLSNPVVEAMERRREEEERLRREEAERERRREAAERERLRREEELERSENARAAAQQDQPPEAPHRTASGALRVKVRAVPTREEPKPLPDPDSDDIWNQYLQ